MFKLIAHFFLPTSRENLFPVMIKELGIAGL